MVQRFGKSKGCLEFALLCVHMYVYARCRTSGFGRGASYRFRVGRARKLHAFEKLTRMSLEQKERRKKKHMQVAPWAFSLSFSCGILSFRFLHL